MGSLTKTLLIRLAGAVSIIFTLFHAGFYWIFKWSETLLVLNATDRAIMLTFNLIVILFLLYSVVVSLFFTRQLFETAIGKSVLFFFSAFYLLRILAEFFYFGFSLPKSAVVLVLCLIPVICYSLPVLANPKMSKKQ